MVDVSALRSADFEWTTHIEGIWGEPPYDVPEIHQRVRAELAERIAALATRPDKHAPLGVPLVGEAGAGKTHLLGALRKLAYERGAGFVLVDMTDVHDFWATAQLGFLNALQKPGANGRQQFRDILQHLYAHHIGAGSGLFDVERASRFAPARLIEHIEINIRELVSKFREAMAHADVIRALQLINSEDYEAFSVGDSWLQGLGLDEDVRRKYSFRQPQMQPSMLLQAISWLWSLRGPLVVAFDQLDAIVAEHNLAAGPLSDDPTVAARQRVSLSIIDGIAGGLMGMRDRTSRTLTVVSCLEATWQVLEKRAVASAVDRFESPLLLRKPDSAEALATMIAKRLGTAYARHGINPPYPTYPFARDAFQSLHLAPREVLKRCQRHLRACIAQNRIVELMSLREEGPSEVRAPAQPQLSGLDVRFEALRRAADIESLKSKDAESGMKDLLETACGAWLLEQVLPEGQDAFVDKEFAPRTRQQSLDVRIRIVDHTENDREKHLSFRFIDHDHPTAFQARLHAALTASGIDRALDFRRLRVVRFAALPAGPKSRELIARFRAAGGEFIFPTDDDLRTMRALKELAAFADAQELEPWRKLRKPASRVTLFADASAFTLGSAASAGAPPALAPPPSVASTPGEAPVEPASSRSRPVPLAPPAARVVQDGIAVGRRVIGGAVGDDVVLALDKLPRHAVILAGAGSGKTVLVRRIVEEAALFGIPSIVIDAANDLARLGDPWPQAPADFDANDMEKAKRYFTTTETIVWTPGRADGNPLKLEPLPDLRPLAGQGDEFQIALDLARSALQPLLMKRAAPGRPGVLDAVLAYQARNGPPGLAGLLNLLTELPPDASGGFDKAGKIAREMADALREQLRINPLLRVEGAPLDPAILFGSANGRTRISVINLSGLPSLEMQQSFVQQLAMTLFTWIKAHPPASGKGLRGLLVLDEAKDFVPSVGSAASRDALVRLGNQARKYGLGLVFATQAPRSIDHNIIANCTTSFYGKASSPAAIHVIEEQLKLRGGNGDDVARLQTGVFWSYTEGMPAPQRLRARMCLSHHPQHPLDESGILQRARRAASTCAVEAPP